MARRQPQNGVAERLVGDRGELRELQRVRVVAELEEAERVAGEDREELRVVATRPDLDERHGAEVVGESVLSDGAGESRGVGRSESLEAQLVQRLGVDDASEKSARSELHDTAGAALVVLVETHTEHFADLAAFRLHFIDNDIPSTCN